MLLRGNAYRSSNNKYFSLHIKVDVCIPKYNLGTREKLRHWMMFQYRLLQVLLLYVGIDLRR
jgi:hypothetical protein